jgi:methyl coenzyme M reductase subunit C
MLAHAVVIPSPRFKIMITKGMRQIIRPASGTTIRGADQEGIETVLQNLKAGAGFPAPAITSTTSSWLLSFSLLFS